MSVMTKMNVHKLDCQLAMELVIALTPLEVMSAQTWQLVHQQTPPNQFNGWQ